MSQTYTPKLTTYLYASEETPQDELNSLIARLEETNIIVSLHEPADPVIDFNSKKPRVYLSIGSNWMDFPTLKSMPFHEKNVGSISIHPTKLNLGMFFIAGLAIRTRFLKQE